MSTLKVFHGTPNQPHPAAAELLKLEAPPWRDFRNHGKNRGQTYLSSEVEVQMVNASLRLRRPLLLTGPPGSGKSSLSYAIAKELQLGDVLKWPINSRSVLTDGFYHYDAIARLRDANLAKEEGGDRPKGGAPIEQYLKLRWLGTALASATPRVVLIDEIDKADVDLPNDLLDVLEEGTFTVPELERLADTCRQISLKSSEGDPVMIEGGRIQCSAFPVIVITSNGERELPMAFLGRCLRVDIQPPDEPRLRQIVAQHLGQAIADDEMTRRLIQRFVELRDEPRVLATDQLLNLVHLMFTGKLKDGTIEANSLQEFILRGLDS